MFSTKPTTARLRVKANTRPIRCRPNTLLFQELSNEEQALLKEMKAWAESATARLDAKAKMLIKWLRENIRPMDKWSDDRVIIFTEYRATQNWLTTILASEGFTGGERLMTLYGAMDSDDRERIKAAFQTDPAQSPVRILLATDEASEGIDLQNHCSKLVHYEIPWNPNRLEQRNGRHPAVIAHARLVVIGGDRHRLHEEIITAGGWLRSGKFVRFGTLREMQDAVAAATDRKPSVAVQSKLFDLWPKTSEALRQALEARMKDRTDSLKKALSERAEKDVGHQGDLDRTTRGHTNATGRSAISTRVTCRA
jgi:superfamily II DNA/RNA helicase